MHQGAAPLRYHVRQMATLSQALHGPKMALFCHSPRNTSEISSSGYDEKCSTLFHQKVSYTVTHIISPSLHLSDFEGELLIFHCWRYMAETPFSTLLACSGVLY
jgi:hypothetical protein